MDQHVETKTLFDELFSETGILKGALPGYERRDEQREMAKEIWEAFEKGESALIEAGTGIGKSMAYLIAALYWNERSGEKIVISTYTIALQQQLIEKDLPCLLSALGLDTRVVLAKGMGNYLCLRKGEELEQGDDEEGASELLEWARKTTDGTRSSLPFSPSASLWQKVSAESEACPYAQCPHFKRCHFFRARSDLQEADLIIVNHHLLMAHLLSDEKQPLLPEFGRIIIDEAHHLPKVATGALGKGADRVTLFRKMARLHSEQHPETSRFLFLRDEAQRKGERGLSNRLGLDLPAEKRRLQTQIQVAFDALDNHFMGKGEGRTRITPMIQQAPWWSSSLSPLFKEVATQLRTYSASLSSIETELKNLFREEERKGIEPALYDLSASSQILKEFGELIEEFFGEGTEGEVRWIEQKETGCHLCQSKLDVAPFMEKRLFESVKSAILCSATLTLEKSFSPIVKQLGLEKIPKVERIYHSPFNYLERTHLLVPSDLPPPNAPHFLAAALPLIEDAIEASGGGAFLLFTSYDMLRECNKGLQVDYPRFVQGEMARNQLVELFKEKKNGVLLGADSFWEGIDVAGPALRLVIITKLPFPVPTDPLLQARGELLQRENKNPFLEDSLPQAVIKFKQGFGRLMRTKQDRGVVLCLDNRLATKSYGHYFLKSLPECRVTMGSKEKVKQELNAFFR